jgi:ligand-binding sensor domain-containing protein/DNA-binding CsgD family transcriptional regulator
MKKILALVFFPVWLFGQNTIGLPDVMNYSKQAYGGGLQNWDITQDKNGIIYCANNEGLLTFDGKYWTLYPLPNKTIVRSVKIGLDNKIYVGGQDELGYFSPSANGQLNFHSLTHLITEKNRNFGDVWDIVSYQKDIFFRSASKIFKFSNQAMGVFSAPNEWTFLGSCNDQLYAHDFKQGLLTFENNVFTPVYAANLLPQNDPVTGILPLQKDSIIITTLKNGLYIATANNTAKLNSITNSLFAKQRIYAAIKISEDWLALATSNNGVYIIDTKGNIIQTFSKIDGLQNNNILSIFLDTQHNLWLGLDNGIDFVAYNSSIKHISPSLLDGSGYTARVFNNKLYAGTSNGLYSIALQAVQDLSFSKGSFENVANTNGQSWSLAKLNNQLLLGHHEGAFLIKDNAAVKISANKGFWNFLPLTNTFPSPQIFAGNYHGIQFFNFNNNNFTEAAQVSNFEESSRFIALDDNNNIWVSHPYHGIYKLTPAVNTGVYTTKIYTNQNGLPSSLNNHVYKIKNEIVVATEKGVFYYNTKKDAFEPSAFYEKLLGKQSVRYLKEDDAGNIWFIHEKNLAVVDFSGKEPIVIPLPELNNKMLSGHEFIYPINNNNILLGSEKGFFHINYEKYKKNIPILQTQIKSVRIIDTKDSLLFGGYHSDVNEKQIQDIKRLPAINNNWKTIRFEFSSPLYGYQSNLEYSYRLIGFNEQWSEWTKRNDKEYTNLPAGKYSFEVKVRNNLGNESTAAIYTFTVLPSWYLSIWAKILYAIVFCLFNYVLYKWLRKKFKLQQQKHDEEQRKLLYVLELERSKRESEIVALKNEKLEAEINYKNSELAASAMHLLKKGELLAKVKAELAHLMKGVDRNQINNELKKMIKAVSEDDNMDKEWESFTKHFDKVHSDFLILLKEKNPTISPNELKLCAYLRMNLSTKEIAQLMNISVRGVEISRYRLRKKLSIPTEMNLFDYLINLQPKRA